MPNRNQTSARVAEMAAEALRSSSSPVVRKVAGAVLTQTRTAKEQTSPQVAKAASQILNDSRFGKAAKALAGSALSQTKTK